MIRSATKLTAELIDRATNLKVIGRAGVGVDNVDVEAATRRGIVVANAPESNMISAAEHTIGLLVALSRNIPQAHAALKQGRWERSRFGGVELADKTLGVLGFGRIGQQVARRALGLGMKVTAYDPFVSRDRFRELGVDRVETPAEVLAVADFITLHLPLTDETRHSIDAATIAQMRDGVRIVNAARGELIDEQALYDALVSGKVAGAALDVYSTEPYDGPLLELEHVVATPHLAASTDEAQDRAGVIVAEQVVAALEGGLVTNAVNIPVIGAEDLEALGPYIPLAAKLGRLAMELAAGRAERALAHVLRRPCRARHAAPHRRRPERRLPGPRRPVGQLRQRAARRGRARDRGARGASRRLARLHEPDPRRHRHGRRGAARGRDDDRHREPALARERARLRGRHGARAADGLPRLRRHSRRDRARRHALRRRGDQHREHGRLALASGREGADGALDRHAAPPELQERLRAEGFDEVHVIALG